MPSTDADLVIAGIPRNRREAMSPNESAINMTLWTEFRHRKAIARDLVRGSG